MARTTRAAEALIFLRTADAWNLLGDKTRALEFQMKTLALITDREDKRVVAGVLIQIARLQAELKAPGKDLEFSLRALELITQTTDRRLEASTRDRIASLYEAAGDERRAISFYADALALYNSLGDRENEGATSRQLGVLHRKTGDDVKAAEYFERCVPLARATKDAFNEGICVYNVGFFQFKSGAQTKALQLFERALVVFRAAANEAGEASTLAALGVLHFRLGDKTKGVEFLEMSLAARKNPGNGSQQASALSNLGYAYADIGLKEKAAGFYERAAASYAALGEKANEATMRTHSGRLKLEMGNTQGSLDQYALALDLFRTQKNNEKAVSTLHSIAKIYSGAGNKAKALEFFDQALVIHRASANRRGEAETLLNMGLGYSELGEKVTAAGFFERAATTFQVVGDKTQEAIALSNLGRVYQETGKEDKATAIFQKVIDLNTAVRDAESSRPKNWLERNWDSLLDAKPERSGPLVSRGPASEVQEVQPADEEASKSLLLRASFLQMSRKQKVLTTQASDLADMMYLVKVSNNPDLAIIYGKQAVGVYQQLREKVKNSDRGKQAVLLRSFEDTCRTLAALLIEQGRIPEAEQVLRVLKEQEYYDFVRGGTDPVSDNDRPVNLSPAEERILSEYEKEADRITKLGAQREELNEQRLNLPPAGTAEIVKRINEINRTLANAEDAMRVYLESLKASLGREDRRIAGIEEGLQSQVKSWDDPHAVVISTIVSKDRVSVFVTTSEVQTRHSYKIEEAKLNKLVSDFRVALSDPKSDPKKSGQELYDILIKPLQGDLDGVKARTLVWSLDGSLRYAPMSALWDAEHGYLAQRYSNVVITLASRSNLGVLPELKDKRQWKALGVGVSKAATGFDPLKNVPGELRSIVCGPCVPTDARPHGLLEGQCLLDGTFTGATFRDHLGRYPVVHAATHFRFISGARDDLLGSYLLLGNGEKLTLADIQRAGTIFNGVQLLALSACDTALGDKDADGREVEGFGALAQKKGAKAVLASLWLVSDVSTRDLMVEFYGNYLKPGLTKAEALRQAQIAMLGKPDKAVGAKAVPTVNGASKPFAHPYFWSPFILIGNWR